MVHKMLDLKFKKSNDIDFNNVNKISPQQTPQFVKKGW